ncbi:MFS transporter [Nonomuraea typhae]|uniref:MFS transporter n=1 Tax=Nonomuraea typhae TaxID=2603600 RepID=UPI0012FA3CBF|nr:MFS transporter [Nonomuraea typhae]
MLWRYMAGAAGARTGDDMSGPALLVVGLAVSGSPAVAGWLLAGLTVSASVGGPVLGVLLDRSRRPGRLLAWCLAGYSGGLMLILGLLGRAPDGLVIALAVLAGLLGPALSGGWTAQIPLAVPAGLLSRATALDSISYNVAALLGPALAGLVATLGGGSWPVIVAAALIAASLPIALTLPARHGDGTSAAGGPSIAAELAAGMRAITGSVPLRRATATSMVSMAGIAMLVVCTPLLGERLAGGAGHGTLLLAVTAATALAANAVLARLAPAVRPTGGWWPDGALVWATALLGAGIGLTALADGVALAVAGAAIAGVGEGPQLTALFTVRHRDAPARLRSQIFTTGASLKITSFAAGSAVAGPLAGYSVPLALLAGAGLQAVAVLVYWGLSPRRSRTGEISAPRADGTAR